MLLFLAGTKKQLFWCSEDSKRRIQTGFGVTKSQRAATGNVAQTFCACAFFFPIAVGVELVFSISVHVEMADFWVAHLARGHLPGVRRVLAGMSWPAWPLFAFIRALCGAGCCSITRPSKVQTLAYHEPQCSQETTSSWAIILFELHQYENPWKPQGASISPST